MSFIVLNYINNYVVMVYLMFSDFDNFGLSTRGEQRNSNTMESASYGIDCCFGS